VLVDVLRVGTVPQAAASVMSRHATPSSYPPLQNAVARAELSGDEHQCCLQMFQCILRKMCIYESVVAVFNKN